jgi:hypothetical protein
MHYYRLYQRKVNYKGKRRMSMKKLGYPMGAAANRKRAIK